MTEKKHNYIVFGMFILATVLISLALPRHEKVVELTYEQGKPWLNSTLYAPFDIPIELSDNEKAAITDSVTKNFVPIYTRDETGAEENLELLKKEMMAHHDAPAHVKQGILNTLASAYADGIVSQEASDKISRGKLPKVRFLENNGTAQVMPTEGMRSERQVYELLDSLYDNNPGDILTTAHVHEFIQPNIRLNTEVNNNYFHSALEAALSPNGSIQTGEAIIYTGNIVTDQKFTIVKTMERMLEERARDKNSNKDWSLLGNILIVAIMMMMYSVFIIAMRYRVYARLRKMVFLVSLMTLFIVSVFLIIRFKANYLHLIPFAIIPIIISCFFDVRISFFTHIVVVLICSLAVRDQGAFIIMQFLAGCIAISSMQELTRRSQLVRCAFLIFLAYSATHTAVLLSQGVEFKSIDWHHYLYFATNCVILSFAYVAIFVVEKLFGFTSLVTLVELSDINTPVLRQLAERCPGTFQHSLQVANIAAEAALKVGASQQLVRAGALYHDIGKTENPAFFTENQTGINPHDALPYETSASIVIKHVTEGQRIAEHARLPQVIIDLIKQHHGTTLTRYFYTQACKEAGNEPVDPAPYTYPGPRPASKEAAILMMADACEAAAKSLKEHNEQTITALVEKIVDGQIASGQLKDAPISFMHVEVIKKVFIERLKTFYHTRIAYPDDIKLVAKHDTTPDDAEDVTSV